MSIGVTAIPAAGASASQAAGICNPNPSVALTYYYYTTGGTVLNKKYNCTGNHTVNSDGFSIKPGGYSGYVYFKDGSDDYFCDWEQIYLGSKRVVKIHMAEARIEDCS